MDGRFSADTRLPVSWRSVPTPVAELADHLRELALRLAALALETSDLALHPPEPLLDGDDEPLDLLRRGAPSRRSRAPPRRGARRRAAVRASRPSARARRARSPSSPRASARARGAGTRPTAAPPAAAAAIRSTAPAMFIRSSRSWEPVNIPSAADGTAGAPARASRRHEQRAAVGRRRGSACARRRAIGPCGR